MSKDSNSDVFREIDLRAADLHRFILDANYHIVGTDSDMLVRIAMLADHLKRFLVPRPQP